MKDVPIPAPRLWLAPLPVETKQAFVITSVSAPLEEIAQRAYPDHAYCPDNSRNRDAWIRAVRMLRAGRGWVLDGAEVPWRLPNQLQDRAAASSLAS